MKAKTQNEHIAAQAKLWRETARELCGTSLSKAWNINKSRLYSRCREALKDTFDPALEHVYRTAVTKASRQHAAWIRKQIYTGKEVFVIASGPSIERRTIISQTAEPWDNGDYIVWSGEYAYHRHNLSLIFTSYADAVEGLVKNRLETIEKAKSRLIKDIEQDKYPSAMGTIAHIMELKNQMEYWKMRANFPENWQP